MSSDPKITIVNTSVDVKTEITAWFDSMKPYISKYRYTSLIEDDTPLNMSQTEKVFMVFYEDLTGKQVPRDLFNNEVYKRCKSSSNNVSTICMMDYSDDDNDSYYYRDINYKRTCNCDNCQY